MARQLQTDKVLFGTIVVLLLFGLVMVFSASAVTAQQRFGSSYYFLFRQGIWAAIGLCLMAFMMNFDYRRLAKPTVIFPAVAIQLMLLVLILFLSPIHNAHRWLQIGSARFQPSELSKVIVVIFLAYFLDMRKGDIADWKRTLLPIGLVVGTDALLVLKEPDFGTTLALCLIVAAMLFVAGLSLLYFG